MAADKSEKAYDKVTDTMMAALARTASGQGFAFDGEDMVELNKNLGDRKKMVESLKKKLKGKEIVAKDWTPVMSKVDFLSRTTRDLTVRFRTRIGAFRLRRAAGLYGISSISSSRSYLETVQKDQQA